MDKIQAFASGKYELLPTPNDVATAYEERSGEARDQIDNMSINKRMVSTARLVQTQRQNTLSPGGSLAPGGVQPTSTLSRGGSTASNTPSIGMTRTPSAFKKAPPPPPPGSAQKLGGDAAVQPPPPYSAGSTAASAAAAAKRAPPPIPALKPKPNPPAAAPTYVVALYDFAAQVRVYFLRLVFHATIELTIAVHYAVTRPMETSASMSVIG